VLYLPYGETLKVKFVAVSMGIISDGGHRLQFLGHTISETEAGFCHKLYGRIGTYLVGRIRNSYSRPVKQNK
jgi:hypothetical protein